MRSRPYQRAPCPSRTPHGRARRIAGSPRLCGVTSEASYDAAGRRKSAPMRQERTGLRLGRVLGIAIEVDWSWVFIFLLVTWSLADALFPAWHPDWSRSLRWPLAVAGALLFFVSILVHELAHALVARAHKLPVRRITLFLFGGISNIQP